MAAKAAKAAKAPKAAKVPKEAKVPREAKVPKEAYVPYVADDEDDASSVSATPGAAARELFEPSPRGLVFAPAHEKED